MSIRGPLPPPTMHGPPGQQAPRATDATATPSAPPSSPPSAPPSSPLQRLVDFGMAKTPQEALVVLREILALLGAAGLPIGKTGTAEQQFSSALKQLQRQGGQKETGQLDEASLALLRRKGAVPDDNAGVGRAPGARDNQFEPAGPALSSTLLARSSSTASTWSRAGSGAAPEGAQSARSVETSQAKARSDAARPDVEVDLRSMLDALKQAGFIGAGRGREQLQDAVKKLQRVDGLPTSGRLDARTVESLERRGVLDAASALALKEQDPAWSRPAAQAAAQAAAAAATASDARTSVAGAPRDATSQGTVAPQSNDTTGRGAADDASGGGGAGRGVHGGAGTTTGDAAHDGVVDDGDEGGAADGVGRDVAGDDVDGTQGNANVDGDDDAGEHWAAPALSAQIERALQSIRRDDDGRGPATYRLEIVLVRPGVYSSGQPAEELLRVVVERAGPFDGAWQRAIAALNDRLRRHEPDAVLVDDSDVRAALQRARYRRDDG